jgi:hypothetical protein
MRDSTLAVSPSDAEMYLARLQVQRVTAELDHRHLERHAGARRRLLEDHAQRPVRQEVGNTAGVVRLLQQLDQREQLAQLSAAAVVGVKEVLGHRCRVELGSAFHCH